MAESETGSVHAIDIRSRTLTATVKVGRRGDDLDGTPEADETVTFGIDGVTCEIGLSDTNATKLRDTFDKWPPYDRRVGRAKPTRRESPASAPIRRNDLADLRAWASKNGHTVSTRGLISTEVVAATRLRLRSAEGWPIRSWVMFTVIPTSPPAETPVSDTGLDHPPTASSPAVVPCGSGDATKPGTTGASTEVLNAADHFDPPTVDVAFQPLFDHPDQPQLTRPPEFATPPQTPSPHPHPQWLRAHARPPATSVQRPSNR